MNTPLSSKIARLLQERLRSGPYKSAGEVIEEALDALAERENFQAIVAEVDHADQQLARGEYTEYDTNTISKLADRVKTRGHARLAVDRKSRAR